jgi:hypothetical protein
MLLRLLFAFGCFALIGNAGIASAADSGPLNDTVKLTVPVHLKEIPRDITQFSIDCSFRYVGGTHGVYGTNPEHAMSGGAMSNGGYDGNVTLTIVRSTTPPSKINGYFCTLSLYSQQNGALLAGPASINGLTSSNIYSPKSGTDFTPYVEGSF